MTSDAVVWRERNSGKLEAMPDAKSWSDSQEIGAIGEAAFERFALRHGLTPNKAHHDVGTDYFCQATAARVGKKRRSKRVTGAALAFFVRSTAQEDGCIKLTHADAVALLDAHLPACLVLVHLHCVPGAGAPEAGPTYYRFVDGILASRLRMLLAGRAPKTFRPADLKPEAAFDGDLLIARQPGFVEQVRAGLAAASLLQVDPWSRVDVRTGTEGRLGHVAFDDYAAPFDLSRPEHRAQFDRALLGASARVESRLHGLWPRLEFIEASGWLATDVSVSFKAPSLVVTAEEQGRKAAFTAETRMGGGKAVIAHRAGFALTISERKNLGHGFGHALAVHVDEEARVRLEEHPDLWAFLELCGAKATVHVGDSDGVTVEVASFKGLYEVGYFARAWRTLSAIHDWSASTFYLHDALSREVLESMRWLCTVSDPAFDYAFAVTIGGLAPETLEPRAGWLWVPVCINLARSAVITWLGARGQLLMLEGMPAGFSIEKVEEVALELRSERWVKEPFPELVVDPSWPVASLGGLSIGQHLCATGTSAASWGLRTLAGPDREAAANLLGSHRPGARHWRSVGGEGRGNQ